MALSLGYRYHNNDSRHMLIIVRCSEYIQIGTKSAVFPSGIGQRVVDPCCRAAAMICGWGSKGPPLAGLASALSAAAVSAWAVLTAGTTGRIDVCPGALASSAKTPTTDSRVASELLRCHDSPACAPAIKARALMRLHVTALPVRRACLAPAWLQSPRSTAQPP